MTPLPGLLRGPSTLLDERHRPDFRDVFGRLAERSDVIRTAVTRVRLSTVDFRPAELEGVRSFRVLVAEVNALAVDAEARVLLREPRRAARVRMLARLMEDGVLEVRSAPLGGWSPDFTVFAAGGRPTAVLCGYHWFERPYPHRGPALASLHEGPAAALPAQRHDELWERAHDVGPALWSLLARADPRRGRMRRVG